MIKVIIAGTRTFSNYELLKSKCDYYLAELVKDNPITIVSGKEPNGADKLGEAYAKEMGYPVDPYPADWDTLDKAAGPIRNKAMAQEADIAIIFWDGKSPGSKNMISQCKKYDVKYRVINYIA